MKRFHARGRGRGARILKPFAKIIVVRARGDGQRAGQAASAEERWVIKSIPSAFASASTARGTAAGSRSAASTASCCTKTWRSATYPARQAQAGRHRAHHHRASAQEVPRDGPLGASGRPDRQEGRRHREAARRTSASSPSREVHLNIVEIRKPEIDAQLVAETIAQQLERRVAFRRAMKRAVQSALRLGALGIRINCGGPSRRRRNRAHRVVSRRPRAAAHVARRHRLRRRDGEDGLRHLRRQGVDLQGRDHGA